MTQCHSVVDLLVAWSYNGYSTAEQSFIHYLAGVLAPTLQERLMLVDV